MIEKIIELTGKDHNVSIVKYGLNALLNGMTIISVIMLLGILSKRVWESVIYILFCMIGTSTLGGYHCKTRKNCFIYTVVGWGLSISLSFFCKMEIPNYLIMVFLLGSFMVVAIFAPVEHHNKPLRDDVFYKNKMQGIIVDILTSVCIVYCIYAGK